LFSFNAFHLLYFDIITVGKSAISIFCHAMRIVVNCVPLLCYQRNYVKGVGQWLNKRGDYGEARRVIAQ